MEAGQGRVFSAEELAGLSREELIELVMSQASMIELLMARVERLESEASRDSKTSSKPPSADNQARRAERAEAKAKEPGRKRGKRPGAQGHRLVPVADPDQTVLHRPGACGSCGKPLAGAEVVGTEARQVFDIPEPTPFVTEHRAERQRCSCGGVTAGAFPPEATAPACYGPRLRALAVYMLCRQHVPVERCAELLSDVVGVSVSTGWLSASSPRRAGRWCPSSSASGTCWGAPRSSAPTRPGGGCGWPSAGSTCGPPRPSRCWAATEAGAGRPSRRSACCPPTRALIVHDGLALYDGFGQASHAQCNAHYLRHLAAVGLLGGHRAWTEAMTKLLMEGKKAADDACQHGDSRVAPATVTAIETGYDEVLAEAFAGLPAGPPPHRRGRGGWREHQRQAWNLADRMARQKPDVLRFLTDTRIPFTNYPEVVIMPNSA